MTALWCELAWLGADAAEPGVLVEVDGDRLAAVTRRVPVPPRGAERLAGLTIPGLANAHSHAFQRALRGRNQNGRGSFWTWRKGMYELAERLDPDSYLALARATYGEMALAGISAMGEFHYLHHAPGGRAYEDPNEVGVALIEAARQAGIRITLLDACYLHGGVGAEPDPTQRRFCDRSVDDWAARVEALLARESNPSARLGAAIHSVRAVDPRAAASVAGWASARGLPLHAHVSEQPAENEACVAAHGLTPTEVLHEAGALDGRFTAVHATHLSDADRRLLGEAGVTCCLCPTTERDLADGVGPARELAAWGARLAVGTDSHAVIDPFEEARAIELDERLATGARGHHRAADLLHAATEGGYAALGWPEGGRIESGALADLATIRLDGVALAGADAASAVAAAVYAATPSDVRHLMVGGRWVVRDGDHLWLDVAAELTDAIGRLSG